MQHEGLQRMVLSLTMMVMVPSASRMRPPFLTSWHSLSYDRPIFVSPAPAEKAWHTVRHAAAREKTQPRQCYVQHRNFCPRPLIALTGGLVLVALPAGVVGASCYYSDLLAFLQPVQGIDSKHT